MKKKNVRVKNDPNLMNKGNIQIIRSIKHNELLPPKNAPSQRHEKFNIGELSVPQ